MTELDEQLMKEMFIASRFIMRPPGHPMVQEDIIRKLTNGPMNQKDLQEMMHVRPGSISEIVSKLEEKGYLERQKDENDSRAIKLSLTDKGLEKSHDLKERKDLFSSLSQDEKQQLKDILTKLNNDWLRREPLPNMEHPPFHHGHHHPPFEEDDDFKPPFVENL